jgi:hypothetical protein
MDILDPEINEQNSEGMVDSQTHINSSMKSFNQFRDM